jgi:tetratricopeptide (TPR) repeat protein
MIFFSYRRLDLPTAQPFLDALVGAGVEVWRDQNEISDQSSITAEIRRAIAESKALLAFYSKKYPASNPCQQEITTAWLAAQQLDPASPNRRVWIYNPESTFDHIPELLRDQQSGPLDSEVLKKRLLALDETLLGSGVSGLPEYYGMNPVQARTFVGRASELWDLHSKLTANRTSIISGVYGQTAAQIRGLGGTGKSLLAREYSIRFGPAFPGGVFWLNAMASRVDQMREFAVGAGVAVAGLSPDAIESGLWHTLEKRAQPCLWIVDDVPSGLNPDDLQKTCFARWAGASTLITTRSREYGSLGATLDLGVLSSSEARMLLLSHRKTTTAAENEAADEVAGLLGFHPLAVDVAGGYLALGLEDFETYAESLRDPMNDAVEFGDGLKENLPTGHERSISATLLKSIRQLQPQGLDFLMLASVLAVAPISVDLVADVFNVVEDHGKQRAGEALSQADSLSLCERSGEAARSVHTLVTRTIRFQFPNNDRTARLRSAAIQVLKDRLKRIADIGEYAQIENDVPHARRLTGDDISSVPEISLALWLAHRDYQRGQYSTARSLGERTLTTSRRLLGPMSRGTLAAGANLGQTLFAQGDLKEARQIQEWVLPARGILLGLKDHDTLVSKGDLALTMAAQGELQNAYKLQEEVVEARWQPPGKENVEYLTAMNNLAQMLYKLHDLQHAQEYQVRVLEATRRLEGDESLETLASMINLALTLKERPNGLAEAKKMEQFVVARIPGIVGEEHPDTLAAKNNLAATLILEGDYKGAREILEPVLAAAQRVLGDYHPTTLWAMHNLATSLFRLGEHGKAIEFEKAAVAGRSRVLGKDHPDTVGARDSLAAMIAASASG